MSEEKKAGQKGNFFHIDRRTWAALCDTDDVKLAVAYLAIAQGTWKGGRLSAWSAKSVETHTGMHSTRAKAKIETLIKKGFLRLTPESTRRSPRYEVLPFHEIRKCKDTAAELIWLPNSIVQGTSAGEPAPLRLLRGRNEIWVLRLFIDLYDDQNLSAEGGISRFSFKQKYERQRLGQRGRHLIWGFTPESTWVRNTGAAKVHYSRSTSTKEAARYFFESLEVLTSLGLVYPVAHLVENDDDTCEIIHPFGIDDQAETMEREIADAAQSAGAYMLGEELANIHTDKYLVPVFDSYPNTQLVGVYRLRYRPKTSLTADWMRRLKSAHREWTPLYLKLAGQKQEAETLLETA